MRRNNVCVSRQQDVMAAGDLPMAVTAPEQGQGKPPAQEECTACKLWAQASSAFLKPPVEKPGAQTVAPVEAVQQQEAVKLGGVHSVPGHDCMACRVSGTVVSLACSAFLTRQLYKTPPPVGAHRVAIMAFAGGFAVMGALRAAV